MPSRTDESGIRFVYAPNLPMNVRLTWIAGLVLVGVAIQMAASVPIGWLFVLAGALLGVIGGRSIQPEISSAGEWQTTTIEELEEVERLSGRIGEWREKTDPYRPTSGSGCALMFAGVALLAFISILIAVFVDRQLSLLPIMSPLRGGLVLPIWIIDSLTMLIPIWFFGRLTAWEPPLLLQKAQYLLGIYRTAGTDPELEFLPSLYVSRGSGGGVPTDCRLLVKFRSAPAEFIGVQIQVSMNDVQGRKYPYCYSVIVAKKEFGLGGRASPLLKPSDGGGLLSKFLKSANDRKESGFMRIGSSIAEVGSESDVDVVVVRQVTAGQGYHTTETQAMGVFRDAIKLARAVLGLTPGAVR